MNSSAAKPTMLVTGAAGMVGSYVREIFGDYNLLLTDQVDFDLRETEKLWPTPTLPISGVRGIS